MAGCNDAALVAAAILGKSLDEIAKAAGASKSTVQRRLRVEGVKEQIRVGRADLRDQAVGQFADLRSRALCKLSDLIDDDDARVAMRAITVIINSSLKFEQLHDLDIRLTAVEAALSAEIVSDGDGAEDETPDPRDGVPDE